MQKNYPASLDSLERIAEDAENFCAENRIDATSSFALNLCLDEIFTNCVMYGYKGCQSKEVSIKLEASNGELLAEVIDDACAFNPLEEIKNPNLDGNVEDRQIGGLGVFLVKKNMDKIEYSYEGGKNILRMYRKYSEEKQ